MIRLSLLLLFISGLTLASGPSMRQYCRHLSPEGLEKQAKVPIGYDAAHFTITIDSIDMSGGTIRGNTEITVVSQQSGLSQVSFSLLEFTVDSVISPGQSLTHVYDDTTLTVDLSVPLMLNDTVIISIHYHGSPSLDASGWGGFYFSGAYAFNLGVGFLADPHNYGRAWYPCIDEFTSRSSYDFFITTGSGQKAFCNGDLIQQTGLPNGSVIWHWRIEETIPSYLVSMAVGPYLSFTDTSAGIPVEFACIPSDTNNIKATFTNLDSTVAGFSAAYGTYPFSKIGYCLIPFNSGAMEHATSIHIGRVFINGTQSYSTLWAHELSHMWWGDKVTCASQEDMWLNEGFASFNEAFYYEVNSGKEAYTNWIRSNHREVVQFAHTPAQDGSYLTLNNIPHEYTYGSHVYNKGASIAHTLRGYMGDSAFFEGCKYYMNNRAYSHASSYDLRDDMTAGSGSSVSRFFDDWVFTPGFPHFSIDSVNIVAGAFDHVYVHTRQRSKGVAHLYEMPVDVNLTDGLNDTTFTVLIDSATNTFHFPLLFTPTMVTLDRSLKITDAIVDYEKEITTPGVNVMYETNVVLNVQNTGPSNSLVRVEHNYVMPDPFKQSNPGIRLSDYHYWKVDGLWDPAFISKATFVYDGSTSPSSGYLDNTLITGSEDSLVILYREDTWADWQIVNSYILNTGPSVLDKRGTIIVDTLRKGEYAFGILDHTVGFDGSGVKESRSLSIYPNPAKDILIVEIPEVNKHAANWSVVRVLDTGGRMILEEVLPKGERTVRFNTSALPPGIYLVNWSENDGLLGAGRFIVQ
jgi:aminopeptidase N